MRQLRRRRRAGQERARRVAEIEDSFARFMREARVKISEYEDALDQFVIQRLLATRRALRAKSRT